LGDASASEFYAPTFWNTICSIFIGRVNKKNDWDEIIQVKVYLKRSLGQLERGGMGRAMAPVGGL